MSRCASVARTAPPNRSRNGRLKFLPAGIGHQLRTEWTSTTEIDSPLAHQYQQVPHSIEFGFLWLQFDVGGVETEVVPPTRGDE
jgi:hypothetical protein